MDIHKNAGPRLTVERQSSSGSAGWRKASRESPAVGICPKTVRKWVARAQAGDSLTDRSSRPQHVPTATPVALVEHVERLRRQRWMSAEIAERLRLGRSTVARYLARRGLARLRALEPVAPA